MVQLISAIFICKELFCLHVFFAVTDFIGILREGRLVTVAKSLGVKYVCEKSYSHIKH